LRGRRRPRVVQTPGTSRHFPHENRQTAEMSEHSQRTDREAKAHRRAAAVPVSAVAGHVRVPVNPSSKDGPPSAERGEGGAWTEEPARPSHTCPPPRGARASQGWARVRHAARQHRQEPFPAFRHHLTVDLRRGSCYGLQRQAAPGVERVTWPA
jgi:hypothetical protein